MARPNQPEVDLSEFTDPGRSYVLLVDHILDGLDPERRAKLEAALRTTTISTYRIEKVLGTWGIRCSAGAVGHWRSKYLT